MADGATCFGHCAPWSGIEPTMTMLRMTHTDHLRDTASDLVEAARAFQAAAEQPETHAGAPDALASLEESLQILSAAWYQVAADASPGIVGRRNASVSGAASWPRVDGLSREQEVHVMAALHDVAAAIARCARACRDGQSTVRPHIANRVAVRQAEIARRAEERPRPASREPAPEGIA
jgi:hypothetical protein